MPIYQTTLLIQQHKKSIISSIISIMKNLVFLFMDLFIDLPYFPKRSPKYIRSGIPLRSSPITFFILPTFWTEILLHGSLVLSTLSMAAYPGNILHFLILPTCK